MISLSLVSSITDRPREGGKVKTDIPPTGTLWCDLMDFATAAEGLAQKFGHCLCPYVFFINPTGAF